MKKIKILDYSLIFIILIIWQLVSYFGIISKFLLPSPFEVVLALYNDFGLIMKHTKYTLMVAFIGVSLGVFISFVLSLIMDRYKIIYDLFYPLIIITQTIPTIAIAPLLIIWLGYYMKPKIVLVILSTFFPITISLLNGYKSIDKDSLNLFKTMGASTFQTYIHLKIPASIRYFFSGFKVAISYSVIASVVAEWLGGFYGLGVYMTRVRKAYALDKMFAVIFFITILSLILISVVDIIEKKIIKY